MNFDVAFMLQAFLAALHYLPTTLLLGFLPLLFGSVFGFGIALIRFYQVLCIVSIVQMVCGYF